MNQAEINITVTGAEDGEALAVAAGLYRILVDGEATGGKYTIIEMNVPPGGGPMPHAHPQIEEVFYVADGEVLFKTEKGHYPAVKGAFIRIPFGGGAHAFKNLSDQPARLICTVMPAGLENLFREVSIAGPAQGRAISEKYGHTVYPPDYLDLKTDSDVKQE